MFCYQCEQTAGGATSAGHIGCAGKAGVCGKTEAVAGLQDELTGALIGLARASNGDPDLDDETTGLIVDGLFSTLTNVNFDEAALQKLIDAAHNKKNELMPDCAHCTASCGRISDYDLAQLGNPDDPLRDGDITRQSGDADLRSLKSIVLFGLRGLAAYAYHARALGKRDDGVDRFFYKALLAIGDDIYTAKMLLNLALELGKVNLRCMELLDAANAEAFGAPTPTTVARDIESGPFIVITGHDLRDLERLLEQTDDTGVNVYTHGEMLPAHGYPELRKHSQLRGNLGTAWQNQQREFDGLPAPIVFTTNCLMPPKPSYADRVYTTGVVSYPGTTHLGGDFSAAIEQAKQLGGYKETQRFGGATPATITGFGHAAVLGLADKIVAAVKGGAIKHFFLVGGCDGARPERDYYREFVKATPPDTIVLTLGCGKYRFNDLDLGFIGGLPRLIDIGQCNDAYSAIQIALALADAFKCGVNDLPLSLVLSWYEQKAVAILLTLLHLGVKNIRLGPTLPAFVSPGVLRILVDSYGIKPTATVAADLAAALNNH